MIGSEQTVRRDAKRQDWQLTDTSDFRNPVDRVICAKDLPYGEKFRLRRSPEILHTVPRPSDEGPTLNFIYLRNTRPWFRNEQAKFPAWPQMRLSPVLACF
jgi:hypothetical protein